MAQHFARLSGFDPLTIEQTMMIPHELPSSDHPWYSEVIGKLAPKQPIVFVNGKGESWSLKDAYDLSVFFPMEVLQRGRPTWLAMGDLRMPFQVSGRICDLDYPCLVEARHAGDPDQAIPADRYVIEFKGALPATATYCATAPIRIRLPNSGCARANTKSSRVTAPMSSIIGNRLSSARTSQAHERHRPCQRCAQGGRCVSACAPGRQSPLPVRGWPAQSAGQLDSGNVHDAGGKLVDYDIEAQCHQVFANVRAVLEASGARWQDLLDVTVFLTDMQRDFATYNRIYGEYFSDAQPCRTTLGITALPTPIAIELKCIAVIADG